LLLLQAPGRHHRQDNDGDDPLVAGCLAQYGTADCTGAAVARQPDTCDDEFFLNEYYSEAALAPCNASPAATAGEPQGELRRGLHERQFRDRHL